MTVCSEPLQTTETSVTAMREREGEIIVHLVCDIFLPIITGLFLYSEENKVLRLHRRL